jgi:transposase
MRGADQPQSTMWSYLPVEDRIPRDHPLRPLRAMVNEALRTLSPRFTRLYPRWGRPSVPPEQLLRALLLQVLYTIRSERQLMEQLDYNLLYRWFVGLNPDDPVWDATVFTKNRERLLRGDLAEAFFDAVLGQARAAGLLSPEHFTVDGTLIQAWAGQKSFRRKDQAAAAPPDDPGNPTVNFHGERRSNRTHQSTTDPEARLAKKGRGQEAKLAYQGHVLMENRHGLAVRTAVTLASGTAERAAVLPLVRGARRRLRRRRGRVTLGADKGYDTRQFIADLRAARVTPHVAAGPHTSLDGRTTRHPGYTVSQTKRKRVEEIFGWLKTVGLMRQTRHRGRRRVGWMFTFATAVYNLVRLRTLTAVPA